MPRSPKPWFWKARKQWVVNISGKRHYLGPDKEEAHRQFHERMALPAAQPDVPSGFILHIFELFMDWVQANRASLTYRFYRDRIDRFVKAVGNMRVADLKTHHAQTWLDRQTEWSDSYKAGVVASVKRAFSWAVKQDLIDRNPLQGLKKPQAGRRDQVISPETFEEILAHVPNQNFRDIARFSWFTGSRPEEAVIIEPRHYEREHKRVVLPPDEAKGRKRARIIYLPDEAVEILERNLGNTPVFVNTLGRPWNCETIASTFDRIRVKMGEQRMKEEDVHVTDEEIKKLVPKLSRTKQRNGKVVRKSKEQLRSEARRKFTKQKAIQLAPKFCMYALRHSFANQSIVDAGLSLEETAAALGHTSTKMVYEVYGHLVESPEHMQKLVNRSAKARNGGS